MVVLVAGLTHIIMGLVPGWLVVMRVIYTRYNQQPDQENHAALLPSFAYPGL